MTGLIAVTFIFLNVTAFIVIASALQIGSAYEDKVISSVEGEDSGVI